jgi:hypothetical protein
MSIERRNSFNNYGRIANANASTSDKTPKNLNEAILRVAESEGADGKGKDGLVGYLKRMARKHPQSFVALLSRVPPKTATVSAGKIVYQTGEESLAAIREYGMTSEDLQAMARRLADIEARAELGKRQDDSEGSRRQSRQKFRL